MTNTAKRLPVVASYGGGTNSTAMLIGMVDRREPCDLILFADTGGEKPHTYEHNERFSAWLVEHGMPPITVVRKGGKPETLEENCLRMKMLPSIAYGFKGCSHKYKIEPQDSFCNNNSVCRATWDAGNKVVKLIGFDMDEPHRAQIPEDKKYRYRYPLIEWGWGREECVQAIERAGLPLPGKSACFFCPSSKKVEIKVLRRMYPDLAARAVALERNAELTEVKGLGRSFAWGDLYEAEDRQTDLFGETTIQQECMCYDGEAA